MDEGLKNFSEDSDEFLEDLDSMDLDD